MGIDLRVAEYNNCKVLIEKKPEYPRRRRWIVHIFLGEDLVVHTGFELLGTAQAWVEDWLKKNEPFTRQVAEGSCWGPGFGGAGGMNSLQEAD